MSEPTGELKEESATTLQVGQRIGHSQQFVIERIIGRGGFGEVYLAMEERAHRSVAIKVLLPKWNRDKKMVRRFRGEYILGTRLSHPSLVQMYDLAETADGILFIVMEFIQGDQLAARMDAAEQTDGQLGVRAALQIGWQLGSLFAQLHERRIIHRDLKPGNILVVSDETIPGGERYKLLDFGIAKLSDQVEAERLKLDIHTTTGIQLGTVPLMSPESFRQTRVQGPATDVYALGCMLYRCIAGNFPFEGADKVQIAVAHMIDEPTPLTAEDPTVPAGVADVIHRMLAKEPAQRPGMSEVGAFFAQQLGLASALNGQVVVRGGTQELQAFIGDLSTGSGSITTEAEIAVAGAPHLDRMVEPISIEGGQPNTVAESTPKARRTATIVAGILGMGIILGLAVAPWDRVPRHVSPSPAPIPSHLPTEQVPSGAVGTQPTSSLPPGPVMEKVLPQKSSPVATEPNAKTVREGDPEKRKSKKKPAMSMFSDSDDGKTK